MSDPATTPNLEVLFFEPSPSCFLRVEYLLRNLTSTTSVASVLTDIHFETLLPETMSCLHFRNNMQDKLAIKDVENPN